MLNYRVHEMKRVPGTNQAVIVNTNPYVRIKHKGNPALYIQKGNVYSAGGPKIRLDDIPDWFWTEVELMNGKALQEVNFDPKVMKAKLKPQLQAVPEVKHGPSQHEKKKTTKKRGRPKRITNGDD